MLAELHQNTQVILRNKASNWKTIVTFEKHPLAGMHENLNQCLLRWINQLEEQISDWHHIWANLRNLQGIKEQLEETPWHYLPPKNTMARDAFINDLLFYTMVCSLLRLACRYFKSYCHETQLPAKVYLFPSIQIPAKKLESLLKPYFKQLYWLEETCFKGDIEYLNCYNQLIERTANLPDSEAAKGILTACIPTLNALPDNHHDESIRIDRMKQMMQALDKFMTTQDWSAFRTLLAHAIPLSEGAAFQLDDYIAWTNNQLFNKTPLEEELIFWKQTFTHYKVINPNKKYGAITLFYDKLIKYLKGRIKKNNCSQVCKRFVQFRGTPADFARHIYQFVEHRQLTINNSDNLKEVSRYFYDLVLVKHSKCNKRIDFETIYSYVRRYSNGEMA